MRHKSVLKLERLALISKSEAASTLKYLCDISESDFAQQLVARNPQWGLVIKDETNLATKNEDRLNPHQSIEEHHTLTQEACPHFSSSASGRVRSL